MCMSFLVGGTQYQTWGLTHARQLITLPLSYNHSSSDFFFLTVFPILSKLVLNSYSSCLSFLTSEIANMCATMTRMPLGFGFILFCCLSVCFQPRPCTQLRLAQIMRVLCFCLDAGIIWDEQSMPSLFPINLFQQILISQDQNQNPS